jgi:hypothetical protein
LQSRALFQNLDAALSEPFSELGVIFPNGFNERHSSGIELLGVGGMETVVRFPWPVNLADNSIEIVQPAKHIARGHDKFCQRLSLKRLLVRKTDGA